MAIPAEKVYLEADRIGGPIPVEALSAAEVRQVSRENVALRRAAEAVALIFRPSEDGRSAYRAMSHTEQYQCQRIACAAIRAFLKVIDPEGNLVVAREGLEDDRG